MLLILTHVVTDIVIGGSTEEKDILNIMLGYSPKGRTVHQKLSFLFYCLRNILQLSLAFPEYGKSLL